MWSSNRPIDVKPGDPARRPPFRPSLPGSGELIDWPDTFGRRFVVFVDTEEEFDWNQPLARANRSVETVAALPAAMARFAAWRVPVALMVDHPVATDLRAIETIGPLLTGGNVVGAQLHPWVNPPFVEEVTPLNSFAGNLAPGLEAEKLDALTQAIEAAFDERPFAYRAGRYGIGPATFDLLAERGYRIDASIRPRFSYAAEGGPDFSAFDNRAFRTGPGGALIELPSTTIFTGTARRQGAAWYRAAGHLPRGRGVLARSGLLSRVPLTPEGVPVGEALEAIRIAAGEGLNLLSFAFHSPSLVPGHTPFVRSAEDLRQFWDWWDKVIAELGRIGIRAAGLDEVVAAAG